MARCAVAVPLCAVAFAAGALAQPPAARTTAGSVPTIAVDEIRPGMRGHGLTVFRGTEPERFEVEVIDVLHNFRANQDLILVRTTHPLLEHAATVAGMSGSPIYLDGRLAGAYAYGWTFGKDPIAGVTPIANMQAEMYRALRPDAFPGAGDAPAREIRGAAPRPSALVEVPRAMTPLAVGGLTDSVARLVGDGLASYGFVTLQAGGAGARRPANASAPAPAPGRPFVPGGSIAVDLVRGDISIRAIGTVTHVEGDRVLAFGHPMLGIGQIGLPVSTSRVLHILASEERSFKIAESLEPAGTLIHDRQATIVVDTSMRASTVQYSVDLTGVGDAPKTHWEMELADHRVLTPLFALAGLLNAVRATAGEQTDVMFSARTRVELSTGRTVEFVDEGYMPAGPDDAQALGALRLFPVLEAAYRNPFEPARPRAIHVSLGLRFAREVHQILDAFVASDEVDPGAVVPVQVLTRRYGEPERLRVVPVTIPETAAGTRVEIRIEPGNASTVEQPIPRSFDDVVDAIVARDASTDLAVSVVMPSRGLRFRGHVVSSLPASVLDTLQLANSSSSTVPFTTQARQVARIGEVLGGSARLTLNVRAVPRSFTP